MEVNKINNLSFYNDQGILTIPAKQFDTGRKFTFNIIADDEPFDLSNCTAYLRILKADGTQFESEECCSISGNTIIIDTSISNGKQILTASGLNKCEIHLMDDSNKSLTTWDFNIEVKPRVHDGSHIDSIDSWDAWDKMKNDVYNLKINLDKKANIDSPILTGTPKAPTAAVNTNTEQIATTAFVQTAFDNSKDYTDAKIADLINGAPETLDTLKEVADAINENETVVEALDAAIGNKVDKVDGKGLSTNDFTNDDKERLNNLAQNSVTGVKGNSESSYRAGNVNITAANVGALPQNGNAASASKWNTQRNVNGLLIDGTANRVNFGVCSTASNTNEKTVSCTGFQLVTGAEITVKFNNSISSAAFQTATLNVNNTGAKSMKYRGSSYLPSSSYIQGLHNFRYDGTYWNLVGDLNSDTNTHAIYSVDYDPEEPDSSDMDYYDSDGLYIAYADEDAEDNVIPNSPPGASQWGVIVGVSSHDSDERMQLAIPIDVPAFDGIYQRSNYDSHGDGWKWTDWKLIPTNEYINRNYAKVNLYGSTTVSVGRKSGTTVGHYSSCFGYGNTASAFYSSVIGGNGNTASATNSAVIGGYGNTASADNASVIGGHGNTASADNASVIGGVDNSANDQKAIILGGMNNKANGQQAVILGGNNNISNSSQVVTGHYNDNVKATGGLTTGTGTYTAFCIGNGTSSATSNAARIDYNGKLWCKASYSSTGADYAELFEWEDGNPSNEDRRGYFVTMESDKIKIASPDDNYILGIVSANPAVLGNTDMEWQGQFMKDEFGDFIKEKRIETTKEPYIDENGNMTEIEKEIEVEFYKVNPEYDPDAPYVDRISRPEWDAVGMMGVLSVYDDGTCEVNGFCTVAEGGIATLSDTGYRVIKRVTDNIVKVIFK